MPEGHEVVVLQAGKGRIEDGEGEERTMRATHRTDEITYWNYDKVPSSEDQLKKAMEWIELAKTLHCEDD